jgi:hypothetical protein
MAMAIVIVMTSHCPMGLAIYYIIIILSREIRPGHYNLILISRSFKCSKCQVPIPFLLFIARIENLDFINLPIFYTYQNLMNKYIFSEFFQVFLKRWLCFLNISPKPAIYFKQPTLQITQLIQINPVYSFYLTSSLEIKFTKVHLEE